MVDKALPLLGLGIEHQPNTPLFCPEIPHKHYWEIPGTPHSISGV